MMTSPLYVAILPSRDESETIAAVARAVDRALGARRGLLVNSDASCDAHTRDAFAGCETACERRFAIFDRAGKGLQVRGALHAYAEDAEVVLLADTDTREPDPSVYAALVATVESGADLAIANYRRYWFEGNLTNHVARPLVLAATGYDVPQPIVGDLALSRRAVRSVLAVLDGITDIPLRRAIDGYGIDPLLVLATAWSGGVIVPVHTDRVKRHAVSFPHLPAVYHDSTPVLLMSSLHRSTGRRTAWSRRFALEPSREPPDIHRMVDALTAMVRPAQEERSRESWPAELARAWHAARRGNPCAAADGMWPAYVERVCAYLTAGQRTGVEAAERLLVEGVDEFLCAAQVAT